MMTIKHFLMLMSLMSVSKCIRPRGVRPELASMYNPGQDFKCFDASNVISFSKVNDDYCDCEVLGSSILLFPSL